MSDVEYTDEEWARRDLTTEGVMWAIIELLIMTAYLLGMFAALTLFQRSASVGDLASEFAFLGLTLVLLERFFYCFTRVTRPLDHYDVYIVPNKELGINEKKE